MLEEEKVIEVLHQGKRYFKNGDGWVGEDYLTPPDSIVHLLNAQYKKEQSEQTKEEKDPFNLVEMAESSINSKDYRGAEKFTRKALEIDPDNKYAAAKLCRILRLIGDPQKALDETEEYMKPENYGLLISRANAYCDLEMWAGAYNEIEPVLEQGSDKDKKRAKSVLFRIKKHKPGLVSDDI